MLEQCCRAVRGGGARCAAPSRRCCWVGGGGRSRQHQRLPSSSRVHSTRPFRGEDSRRTGAGPDCSAPQSCQPIAPALSTPRLAASSPPLPFLHTPKRPVFVVHLMQVARRHPSPSHGVLALLPKRSKREACNAVTLVRGAEAVDERSLGAPVPAAGRAAIAAPLAASRSLSLLCSVPALLPNPPSVRPHMPAPEPPAACRCPLSCLFLLLSAFTTFCAIKAVSACLMNVFCRVGTPVGAGGGGRWA